MASTPRSPHISSPDGNHPKGILKNPTRHSPPPLSPINTASSEGETLLTDKERTVLNTQQNSGHRRSSSAARPGGGRRLSSRAPSVQDDCNNPSPRLKWDEANLYLTEQERTATMKIDEPKTPYVKHYDPSGDPSDDDDEENEDYIPGLSLGEPEEAVPKEEFERRPSKVHVDDAASIHGADEFSGMTAEEREKHERFEQLRKKHYEMRNVAKFLGHPEDLDGIADEDDNNSVPPLPK